MDPTRELCRVRDSFDTSPLVLPELLPFKMIQPPRNLNLNIEVSRLEATPNLPPKYVDAKLFQETSDIKDMFKGKLFSRARKEVNPFENLGKAHFQDRAAMKLANVDQVFKLTGRRINYWQPIDFNNGIEKDLCFTDLAGGPGAFVEYMQYRWPHANGYGITLRDPSSANLAWNFKAIRKCSSNRGGFKDLYGDDNTGNLYVNAESFARELLKRETGCDLVTGDGGIDVDTDDDYYRQEYLNSRLVLSQVYTAMLILKTGGNFVLKIFDSVTEITAQVLYLMACSFEELYLFKPVASRPANAERYIVGKSFRAGSDKYIDAIKQAYHSYNNDSFVINIIKISDFNQKDKDAWVRFTEWLTMVNNIQVQFQKETGQEIKRLMDLYAKNQNDDKIKEMYDLSKCLILWNLPDNSQNQIKFKYC